jgi:L-aspartate oxidase
MRAGDYENNREVVEMVIKEGPDRFREIVEWGTILIKKKTANSN